MGDATVGGLTTFGLKVRVLRRFGTLSDLGALALVFGACGASLSAVAKTSSPRTTASTTPASSTTVTTGLVAPSAQQSAIAFACLCPLPRGSEFPRFRHLCLVKGVELAGAARRQPELAAVPLGLASLPGPPAARCEQREQCTEPVIHQRCLEVRRPRPVPPGLD